MFITSLPQYPSTCIGKPLHRLKVGKWPSLRFLVRTPALQLFQFKGLGHFSQSACGADAALSKNAFLAFFAAPKPPLG
jgi:hypothetical protein